MTSYVGSGSSGSYPYSTVVYIEATFSNGLSYSGSGVVVGANDVLTAAHVVYSAADGGLATSITVYPGRDGSYSPYGSYTVDLTNYYEVDNDGDGLLSQFDSQTDIALLGFDERIGDETGWMGLDPNASGGTYEVTGYPGVYADSSGPRMTTDTGYAYPDSFYDIINFSSLEVNSGNSGGPVWYGDSGGSYVTGIVSTTGWAADIGGNYSTIVGWIDGNDYLIGGTGGGGTDTGGGGGVDYSGPDYLYLENSDDETYAGDGADTVYGNGGNDFLQGNQSGDRLYGGDGDDTLRGGQDNDYLSGGSGRDSLYGDIGADYIQSGAGDDYVNGGRISSYAGNDNDTIFGDDGNDFLQGNLGDDKIYGGNDADTLRGGYGDDLLSGGAGNDLLYGDKGNDVLVGSSGNDTVVLRSGDGADTVSDFNPGTDKFLLNDGQSVSQAISGMSDNTNGYAVINLNGGGSMVVTGVSSSQLGFSDFVAGSGGSGGDGGGGGSDDGFVASPPSSYDSTVSGSYQTSATGTSGNDYFELNYGNQILTGNGGSDVFAFNSATDYDVIMDFDPNNDFLDLGFWGGTSSTTITEGVGYSTIDIFNGSATIDLIGVTSDEWDLIRDITHDDIFA